MTDHTPEEDGVVEAEVLFDTALEKPTEEPRRTLKQRLSSWLYNVPRIARVLFKNIDELAVCASLSPFSWLRANAWASIETIGFSLGPVHINIIFPDTWDADEGEFVQWEY